MLIHIHNFDSGFFILEVFLCVYYAYKIPYFLGQSMVTECSLNLEFMNYTVITSQCKGPKFPVKECCSSFLEFACPYAEQLNDLSTDCASTMFSYINIYGKYPAGLFSSQCKGDKEGLECPDMPPNSVADVNTATTTTTTTTASSRIWMTVALFVTVLLFRGRQSHM